MEMSEAAKQRREWVAKAGGVSVVAKKMNIDRKKLDQWLRRGVPHAHVVDLAEAIGIEPAKLSPATLEKIVQPWVDGGHVTAKAND